MAKLNIWIRLEDRLPNDLQQVLIAHEEGGVMQAVYDECFANGRHKRRFLTPYAQEIYDAVGDHVEITHWMPLPKPPKGEQNAND